MKLYLLLRGFLIKILKESLFFVFYKGRIKTLKTECFDHQSVAIVGGANSAYETELGDFIDSHDLVVRVNKGVEMIKKHKKFIGSRTDLLFHSLYDKKHDEINSSPITLNLWIQNNVKKIVCVYDFGDKRFRGFFIDFFVKNRPRSIIYQIESNCKIDAFKLTYPFVPTTGFCAVIAILNSKFKKLYITGFTFFKTPSITEYRKLSIEELRKVSTSYHNFELEFSLFCELYKGFEDRILVDKALKQIIENYFKSENEMQK